MRPKAAFALVKSNVWDDIGNGIDVAIAEALAAVGVVGTILLGGMSVVLVPMMLNVPLVVPAAAQLLLMLSCDLILIFMRSFKEASARGTHPSAKDVQKATLAYQSHSSEVHSRAISLVPRGNIISCFRVSKVEAGLRNIIEEFIKGKALVDIEPHTPKFTRSQPRPSMDSACRDHDVSEEEEVDPHLPGSTASQPQFSMDTHLHGYNSNETLTEQNVQERTENSYET